MCRGINTGGRIERGKDFKLIVRSKEGGGFLLNIFIKKVVCLIF